MSTLVTEVPPCEVVHHLGSLPVLLPRGDAPALDLPADTVAREIRENGCWVRAGRVDQVDGWSDFPSECLDGLGPTVERQAQVFLAAKDAVTPAHFDTYHNLLHQVHGTKELSIGVFTDPAVARREIANRFREYENLRVLPTEVTVWRLEPGDGLYIPPYAFHWARTCDDVSLALSCTFHDAWSVRARLVETCNSRLRRLGLDPEPPGGSELRDRTKAAVVRSWRAAKRLVG